MRAVIDTTPGGPEVLRVTEHARPDLHSDAVRIAVAAAGLNRADVRQRTGNYKIPAGASKVFGLEVSGVVTEIGPDVDAARNLKVGDRVCALLDSGGYAEEVVAPTANVLPIPESITMEEAAGLPEVLATVWSNIFMEARAQPGETVLIHGGSGGIGSAAIQMCNAFGLNVLTTVGSAAKAEYVRELGAQAIRYDTQDFAQQVLDLTDGQGADIILDVVGAKYLESNIKASAEDGRLVIIGLQGGRTAEIDLARLMGRRLHLIGTTLRARPPRQKAEIMAQLKKHVWPLVESGRIAVRIDRTFPLDEVAAAHEYFDSGAHLGKVLLVP
ncbi:NAD(P)H-quinone oxidoreductase [Kocuria sp.]|uniref:NAD(P)H-quinone oxidoreductase n=1 Tax=Kocuria sp. TaxID=1871328 RepID=UPI0026E0CCA4|nr:NAD(P)H-quinone oxidoreductase [Kocuria sp.]MDO5618006.1 NAD(P)H-quinone oxidoreductase [Kocuria sp.]